MAFENNSIRSFRVPAGVRDLSIYALLGNPLEEYVVDASNKVYSSDGGVLFSKDGTELVRYPENRSGDSYTIPDRVKTVRSYAFYNAGNLKEIVVPASVRKLEDSSLSTVRMERGMDRYHLDYRFLGSMKADKYRNTGNFETNSSVSRGAPVPRTQMWCKKRPHSSTI